MNSNVGVLNDSYLGSSPQDEDILSFYQLDAHFSSEYTRITPHNSYFELHFVENIVFQEYQRFKYNLIDIATAVGGLFNSFYLLGFGFTLAFSYKLFLSSIIRVLYHFPARFEKEISKKKKKDKKKVEQDAYPNDDDDNDDSRAELGEGMLGADSRTGQPDDSV